MTLVRLIQPDKKAQEGGNDKEMTQVVLEQLTSGVAITNDWSVSTNRLIEDSSDSEDADLSQRESSRSDNASNGTYLINLKIRKKLQRRAKQNAGQKASKNQKKMIDEEILLSNDQIYSIIGAFKPLKPDLEETSPIAA